MPMSDGRRHAKAARRGRRIIPYVVLLAAFFQTASILISIKRALDAGRVHGVNTVAQLWEVSQAYESGQEAFTRFEVYVRSEMFSCVFGVERLVIFGAFCLAMIPLLRIIENSGDAGQVRSSPEG